MRLALVLVLAIAGEAGARVVNRVGVWPHADRRDARQPWSAAGPSGPLLSILPDGSSVPGGECSGTAVTAATGQTLTFSRSGSAMCQKSDGIWVSVGNGQMRASSRPGFAALQLENAATNYVHHSRDLSKAEWTKSNMTCAHDAVGIDGTSNSASTCTSSSSNGSALQSAVSPDAGVLSVFVKRVSGSGPLIIKRGSDQKYADSNVCRNILTEAPANPSTDAFVRCQFEGYDATPDIGIIIVTSGDSFIVDAFQDEDRQLLETPTSPIFTQGTTGTRNADVLSVSTPTGLTDTVGCVAGKARKTATISATGVGRLFSYATNARTYMPGSSLVALTDGSNFAFASGSYAATTVDVISAWQTGTISVSANGGTAATAGYGGTMLGANIAIGAAADGSRSFNGFLGNIRMNDSFAGCAP